VKKNFNNISPVSHLVVSAIISAVTKEHAFEFRGISHEICSPNPHSDTLLAYVGHDAFSMPKGTNNKTILM